MHPPRPIIHDWLRLARLSNLPTVVTNVLTGAAIGVYVLTARADAAPPTSGALLAALALLIPAVACLYTAGMILNDVADAKFDARERPERPIPSGRIPRRTALIAAVALFIIALALLAPLGAPALIPGALLIATIVAYNLLHKLFAGFAVLMGVCRALVYALSAAAVTNSLEIAHAPLTLALAISLALYITAVTLIASVEHTPRAGAGPLTRLLAALPAAVTLPMFLLRPPQQWVWTALAGAALLVAYTGAARHLFATPVRTKRSVLAWLAAICLVDAWFLTLLDQPIWAALAAACYVLTILLHQRIAGT
ncbi:MAG: hypothetical protein EA376_03700 [Phycisphaeraceae bacterium]|nr:MAG: hypothetical protein EA376_03700 [Phycisphaeraceae bacterium]